MQESTAYIGPVLNSGRKIMQKSTAYIGALINSGRITMQKRTAYIGQMMNGSRIAREKSCCLCFVVCLHNMSGYWILIEQVCCED